MLTSYPDLAKSDGFVSTVDGQDDVGLSVFYGSADEGGAFREGWLHCRSRILHRASPSSHLSRAERLDEITPEHALQLA